MLSSQSVEKHVTYVDGSLTTNYLLREGVQFRNVLQKK